MSAATALWIALALLVLARGVLGGVPSMWVWGLNVQRFLDPFFGWGLWSVAALSLIPPIARSMASACARLGDAVVGARTAPWLAWIGGAALAWLMPDRVWFVGDFLIRLGNVESGLFVGNYVSALPLDVLLHSALLHVFGHGSAVAANDALRALGAIEAGFLAVLAIGFARALALTGLGAALAAGLVFFGGTLTMFTGLGKPASEMCLATLALPTFGIAAIRNRASLVPCGLVMAAALGLHRSSVMLLPAWALIVACWLRATPADARPRASIWLGIGLPILVATVAIPRILTIAATYDVSHHIVTAEARREGGVFLEALSWRHFLDLANLLVALSPLAIVIPLLRRPRGASRPPEALVLGVLAASFVPALLLVEPQQGIFRDWDVFAPAGVALSMLAASGLAAWVDEAPTRAWLATPALVLAIVSSLQWLALDASETRGLQRVRAYLTEPPGPEPVDRPLVWDFLASRNMRLHRWPQAADAAAHAAVDAPHRRVLLMWALSSTLAADYPTAQRVYHVLLQRVPDDPLGWLGLAGIARRMNDAAELDSAMARLRSYPPGGKEMKAIRRHLQYYPDAWPSPDTVQGWAPMRNATGLRGS